MWSVKGREKSTFWTQENAYHQQMVDLKGQFLVQMNSLEMNANLNWIKLCSFQATAVSIVHRHLDFIAPQAKIVGQTVTFGASDTEFLTVFTKIWVC